MENYSTSFLEIFIAKTGLDIQQVVELYSLFLEELESEIIELQTCANRADYKKVQQIAHNIKGITSNYLAMKVYTIAEAMDLQLKADINENIISQIQELIAEARCFKSEVLEVMNRIGIIIGG